jgi:hypothetical protein
MKITFDPVKRAITLAERGLDFEDATEVFLGDTLEFPDDQPGLWRIPYRYGRASPRAHVIVIWTLRGSARHVISMRKANAREKARFGKRFEEG